MIDDALSAAQQIVTRPFRAVVCKTLLGTVLLLLLAWGALERLVVTGIHPSQVWLAVTVHFVLGLGLLVGAVYLVPVVSFMVASFFFDEMAARVENEIAGFEGRGRAMAVVPALWVGLRFAGVALVVNALALLLLLVPGLNVIAFFGANAYLLGRGFFELAALRYVPMDEMRAIRRRHGLRITVAGCLVAAFAMVPLLNILTPIFATAFMVRVTQPLLRRWRAQSAL